MLNQECLSLFIVDATVMARGSLAGVSSQASPLLFPAATTTTAPAATASATAWFNASPVAPRLMLITHCLVVSSGKAATQSSTA